MPARADARYPHSIRIDSVVGGMRAHEPDRRSNLFHDLGDLESGLGAMDDLEHGEAAIDKDLFDVGPEALEHGVVRDPPSAHHEDHRRLVWFCRLEDVHRERRSARLHIDHVLSLGLSRRQGGEERQESDGKSR